MNNNTENNRKDNETTKNIEEELTRPDLWARIEEEARNIVINLMYDEYEFSLHDEDEYEFSLNDSEDLSDKESSLDDEPFYETWIKL